jgi:hypothetical protein
LAETPLIKGWVFQALRSAAEAVRRLPSGTRLWLKMHFGAAELDLASEDLIESLRRSAMPGPDPARDAPAHIRRNCQMMTSALASRA